MFETNAKNTARNIATSGTKTADTMLTKKTEKSLVVFRIATTAAANK
ncbi:MAG: hypothetical protein IJP61_13455 [Treponema sp.]|nr:hypothetical protein [Treponema sp.]